MCSSHEIEKYTDEEDLTWSWRTTSWQWLFCPWMSRMRAAGVTPHYTAFWKGYVRLSEKKLLLFRQFKMSCFSGRIRVPLKNCTKRAQRREGDFWHSWSDFQWLSSLKLENALMVLVKKIKIFELWRQKLFKPFLCIKQINERCRKSSVGDWPFPENWLQYK